MYKIDRLITHFRFETSNMRNYAKLLLFRGLEFRGCNQNKNELNFLRRNYQIAIFL